MKTSKKLWFAYLFLAGMLIVVTCVNPSSSSASGASAREASDSGASSTAEELNAKATIRIATFNIQNLGLTKMGKADVVKQLVGIVRKYDVIAIQEISDKSNVTANRFLNSINQGQKVKYGLLLSQRSGQQDDDATDQEQYAFYYNTATVADLGHSMLYNDSVHDYFCREPFLAHFKVARGNFSFVICTIHTKPTAALEEIGALNEVVAWAKTKYAGEDDFIVLGDYNASCTYVTPSQLDGLEFRSNNYQWIIADTVKTNLSSKQCAYDRIVITKASTSTDFDGKWGVDRCFTSKAVSDHWPVWAEFYCNKDAR